MRWLKLIFGILVLETMGAAQVPATATAPAPVVPPPVAPSASAKKYFPAFERPEGGIRFYPIAGYRLTEAKSLAGSARSSGLELGVRGGWNYLQLSKGKSGLGLIARGAIAADRVTATISNDKGFGTKETPLNVFRGWAEGGAVIFFKALREELTVARGILKYDYDEFPLVQDVVTSNDLGLRLTQGISVGLQTKYRHVYSELVAEPTTAEIDNWAHLSVRIDALGLTLDGGPGTTYTQESYLDDIAAEGTVRYAQILMSRPRLPYVQDFSGRVKYVMGTSDENLGRYATMRLPEDDLGMPPTLTAPNNTMILAAFFGYGILGAKLGYWFNLVIYDYEKPESELVRQSGLGFFAGYDL